MIKAFTFGKFLPFHKGHEAMIQFAIAQCDFLTVLICVSEQELISGETRKFWLEKTFEKYPNIEIRCLYYDENELPNTSVSSVEVSKIWSKKFKQLFDDYNAVITSENYGNFIASFMGILHIPFDYKRNIIPISATKIKSDIFSFWNFLPNAVKPSFVIKVVILGTESTGKTTLTQQLADYFHCQFVQEVGRELIPDSKSFEFNDLRLVAKEHAKNIDRACLGFSPLIIIDTNIHITKSYASFIFQQELEVDEQIYILNNANLYLYLNNDVEFIQDGTRLNELDRNALDISHRNTLKKHQIKIVEIYGTWEQRFEQSVKKISELIENKRKIKSKL